MTKEDMIRMAKEAGWKYAHGDSGYEPLWEFAALVASAEREKFCAELRQLHDSYSLASDSNAIRAKGQA
jgi:hypothetical protein